MRAVGAKVRPGGRFLAVYQSPTDCRANIPQMHPQTLTP
jgi:hypothetical protein